jgi:hypothetical protein
MRIETYFGFFAESVFAAIASALGQQLGQTVALSDVSVRATNALKLKSSQVHTVLIPELAERVEVPFLFALSEKDSAQLASLAAGRGLHAVMEQALAAAVEPFNFMNKSRNRLRGVHISRNVTGLTAHHLSGAVQYTMAIGRFKTGARTKAASAASPKPSAPRGKSQAAAPSAAPATDESGVSFSVRFLVSAQGRDVIEDRSQQQATQRALYTISSGAYVARPQWEPPPPPPGVEQGTGLSEQTLHGWVQSFFGLNDGLIANRLFQRPAGWTMSLLKGEGLKAMLAGGPVTVVRLQVNDTAALEAFVLLTPKTKTALMQLSKSGKENFLGDLFRAVYSESAQVWERFGESPVRWKVLAVRDIPADALDAVEGRLAGGGFAMVQVARLDDAVLPWAVAVGPHTWRFMLALSSKAMGVAVDGTPNRQAIFDATGWGPGRVPWERMVSLMTPQALNETARIFGQTSQGTARQAPYIVAVAQSLSAEARSRWMAALPPAVREQAERYKPDPTEGGRLLAGLTGELIALNRQKRIPEGKLSGWLTLFAELQWARRQNAFDQILPLRHVVYGMDRSSLNRLVYDVKDAGLATVLAWAEFPVVDQVRRAITPGFAMRLLEDVASRRLRTTAYAAQEAQVALYRRAAQGADQGRYLIRKTPAERLQQVLRILDEA